jgi:hypothetical protein
MNNVRHIPTAPTTQDISKINAIDLSDPNSVSAINAINRSGLEKIINDTLRELPVGNISTHTPESIPERVGYWVRESAKECLLREKWEACADRLLVYALEIQASVKNQAFYEAVCEDIKHYNNLKNSI